MILPIVAFGTPVLKQKAKNIDKDYEGLSELIDNMFQTMHEASGVGLAAPQIGKSIRLFIVDASPFEEDDSELKNFQRVFVNPEILEEEGEEWVFNEGCLSIPNIREDVTRKMAYISPLPRYILELATVIFVLFFSYYMTSSNENFEEFWELFN